MDDKPNTDIERINFRAIAGSMVKVIYKTRFGNNKITGVSMNFHNGAQAAIGSKMRMTIDKAEVFTDDFDCSLLAFNKSTPVNQRWYDYIDRPINQSDIVIEYTDNGLGHHGEITLFLKCEKK